MRHGKVLSAVLAVLHAPPSIPTDARRDTVSPRRSSDDWRGLSGQSAAGCGPRAWGGSASPAFLARRRVTVDALPRLVPPCEAAVPAQKACCDALHHCRMHLTLW